MFSFQPMLKQNWTSIVVWRVGSMGPPTRDIIRSPKGSLPVYQRLTLSPNFQQFSLTLYFTFSLVSIRYNGTIRVLSRIYHSGEKSRVAEGDKRPRGVRPHPRMKSGAFWDTILRNIIVCALTSSFYPSNTLDRTLTIVNSNHFRPWSGSWKDPISPPYS